jgi:hypothetical protein
LDYVRVTPQTRTQTVKDTAHAASDTKRLVD